MSDSRPPTTEDYTLDYNTDGTIIPYWNLPLVGTCFLGDFLLLVTFSFGLLFAITLFRASVLTAAEEKPWFKQGTVKGISSIFTVTSISSIFWLVMTES